MKSLLAIAIVSAALVFPATLHAQIYSINWDTIAGRGSSSGTSGTNIFTASGTIGQPATAAQEMSAWAPDRAMLKSGAQDVVTVGRVISATVPASGGYQYFRLHSP